MTFPARRPWWKKKRWAAAGALWLVVAYAASIGPARYAVARGWVSLHAYLTLYWPIRQSVLWLAPDHVIHQGYRDLVDRCTELGEHHASSD